MRLHPIAVDLLQGGLDDAFNASTECCVLPALRALRKDQFVDGELGVLDFWIAGGSGVPIAVAKIIVLESHSVSWVVLRSCLLCELYLWQTFVSARAIVGDVSQ